MSNGAELITADFLKWAPTQPEGHFDLVFGSPPYEDARLASGKLTGQAWVTWMVKVTFAALRICKGPVAFVVGHGRTANFSWSGTPALLQADLLRAGVTLRDQRIFHRVGIPGSGGPDDFRHDHEIIIFATNGGGLPWSDNTTMGRSPKYSVGGQLSYRNAHGVRKNARDGDRSQYQQPAQANPGNVHHCIVGGGVMGHDLAHENEAPFPESLAEIYVRSFCPPDGLVLDPFSGSGTTAAVCIQHGRRCVGVDKRKSQTVLATRRLKDYARKER